MSNLKRLDTLEVATADLKDAVEVYQRNFGLKLRQPTDGGSASLAIGDAEIRLISASSAAVAPLSSGEGMAAVYLEAEDVDKVRATLQVAGYEAGKITTEGGRRILAIDPKVSNAVPLFIFDRKA
jgi:predicted enzyme related to lactoylglutathione lyase